MSEPQPNVAEVAEAVRPPETNLRGRMLRSTVFELGGYGAQQVLRLGSNLILTRLLFPAAFGLVSIVSVLIVGLSLLSDLAVQPCIIQSRRGDDPAFLNTAFTIQVIRGSVLTALMLLLAKPVTWFYHEPQLEKLIYLGSLQLLFNGLHSTAVFTLRRWLRLGWINALELAQSVVGISVMIVIAKRGGGVWALAVGNVLGSFFFSAASHFLPVPYRNRFHFDKEASREISHFGRWILGSSTAHFLGSQSDRLLMGRFLNATWLGVYTVALTLSEAAGAVIGRLVSGVMYPVLSQAARTPDGKVAELYYRLRLRLDAFSMSGTGLLAGAGGWIVHVLWDKRYTDAAWILRILCFRVAVSLIVGPSETCLLALGHARYNFKRSVTRLIAAAVCIPLGWYLGGVEGLVWGTVATEATTFFAIWPKMRELGILRYRRELLSIGIFAAAFALGAAVVPWLPMIHVR
jgi:O-antigen/teichoic acid export membrane protein